MSHELRLQFRTDTEHPLSLNEHLARIWRLTQTLGQYDHQLGPLNWLLSGDTKEESYLYPVFDGQGPTTAALAVLTQELREQDVMKSVAMWNGQEKKAQGASIAYYFDRADGAPSALSLTLGSTPPASRLGTWMNVEAVLKAAVEIWEPLVATVDTRNYDSVFADRPGVGWMVYLPKVLTTQQVPEAEALIAVPEPGKNQTGTIIVSVTDGPFSDRDAEHVRVANKIEVRLVDQDLLPRYTDL
ncbi:hypothetical protein LMG18102_03196 [Ralstonia mannitolilytica]|uniref:Imm52 family immunity protein n=1 Tax=Ralstonia mannitolilytica TaxID=105219 RepID=UPI0028F6BF1D|nr:Imm52 family immunity protein [Ralstonia mannitolilytica]CAJ0700340.1 hypothetical protein LMG18102_03196 [Ralstonia mannitolilytica]